MDQTPSKPTSAHDGRAILELEQSDPRRAEALWSELSPRQRLQTILRAEAGDRLKLITLAPDSRKLARAMAADEFADTVLALGPGDAGALLELSSDEQLTYLLDLTGWEGERFAPERYEVWLPLILDAGPQRLGRWLQGSDLEVLAMLFAHWFRVEKFLPSQDQQEPPDDLPSFTLDGVYFLEFKDKTTAGFAAQVLVHMRNLDAKRYTTVLEAMIWESGAEMAEDALRWRQGRLRDHGFPDRLEGLELWARPRPGETDWENLPPKLGMGMPEGMRSDAPLKLLPPDELLPALVGEMDPRAAETLMAELAYAANCGAAALEADPAQPQAAAQAGRESLGLLNLGLGLLSGGDRAQAAQILQRTPVPALARLGAQALRDLNHRAFLLIDQGWLREMPTSLHLLDEPLDRWLAGLLYPRPRCFDPNLGEGKDYRPFQGTSDLARAAAMLDRAEFWGRLLFELLPLDPDQVKGLFQVRVWPEDPRLIKTSTLVGVWLARRALGREGLAPIPREDVKPALGVLQKGLEGPLAREARESCRALDEPRARELARELLQGTLDYLKLEWGRINLDMEWNPAHLAGLVVERP